MAYVGSKRFAVILQLEEGEGKEYFSAIVGTHPALRLTQCVLYSCVVLGTCSLDYSAHTRM